MNARARSAYRSTPRLRTARRGRYVSWRTEGCAGSRPRTSSESRRGRAGHAPSAIRQSCSTCCSRTRAVAGMSPTG
jgi:hypothetical protein